MSRRSGRTPEQPPEQPATPSDASPQPARAGRRASGRRRATGRDRGSRGGVRALIVAGAVTGSAFALTTGVVVDRLLLSESGSDSAADAGSARRAAQTGSTTAPNSTSRQPLGQPPPAPGDGAPAPLKSVRSGPPGAAPDPDPNPTPTPSGPGGEPSPSGTAAVASEQEKAVTRLTNEERAKEGCKPLRIDRRLTAAARRHSVDMQVNNYFAHLSLNGDTPWKRMKAVGYTAPGAENIAKGYPTAADVVDGWMHSPGHRANILNCRLRAIGVGMHSGTGGPWWTQDFGWS